MMSNKFDSINDELLSRYIDEELDDDELHEVEQLLEENEDLRKELDMLRQTVDWMGKLSKVEAPDDFALQVRQRVRKVRVKRRIEEQQPGLLHSHWLMLAGIFISILIIVFMMAYYIQLQSSEQASKKKTKTQHSRVVPARKVDKKGAVKKTSPPASTDKNPQKNPTQTAPPKR